MRVVQRVPGVTVRTEGETVRESVEEMMSHVAKKDVAPARRMVWWQNSWWISIDD